MRSYAWLLFAVIAMSGCALWLGIIPGLNGPPGLTPPAPTLQNRDTIDVTSILHTAVSIPERIDNLERSVVVCSVLLGVIGIANAALLTWMFISRRRVAAVLPAAAPVPAVSAPPPVAAPATVAFCAFCACGAAISARTKTGRCRACALDHRESQRARTGRATRAESNGRAVTLPL